MARTTEEAVAAIIELDEDVSVLPFIETANVLITRVCVPAEPAYTDEDLELIERWLSAHFYSVRLPRTTMEGVRGLDERFEGKTEYGLKFTRYGQQAMILDTSGALAALDAILTGEAKPKFKGGIMHLGKKDDSTIEVF